MAKKTKLTEAELIEQNPAPAAAPVQAKPEEVQAATQQAAPVAEAPAVEEEPLVAENEVAPVAEEPVAEAPAGETVSVEVQIPADQLASAVAQVTGDIEVAEQAPDIEAQKQSEIASMENPEANAEVAPEDQPIGDLSQEEQDVIKEYRKYKANRLSENAETAPAEYNAEDEKDGMQPSEPLEAAEKDYKIIKESVGAEGEVCPECGKNPCECEECEECMEACDGDPECEEKCKELCEDEESEDDEDVEDIDVEGLFDDEESDEDVDVSRLADIFGDKDDVEETIDALNTSADFLSKILSMGDEFVPEEEDEVEEEEVSEDPITGSAPAPLADEEEVEEEPEEEEMKESLDFNKLIGKAKQKGFEALGGYDALAREIEEYKAHPEKYAHNPLKPMIDALLVKRGFMDEDHNWIEDEEYSDDEDYYDEDELEDEDVDMEDEPEFVDDNYYESKKKSSKRMRESLSADFCRDAFGRLLKDADMDKSGLFGEKSTPYGSKGFHFYSQNTDIRVDFDSKDDRWCIRVRDDEGTSTKKYGYGWNNLIDMLVLSGFGFDRVSAQDYYATSDMWTVPDSLEKEDDEDYFESKKKSSKPRVKEAIIYPAGSKPLNSAINNAESENLVKAYEKTAAARRQALSNFRESMRKTTVSSQNKAKFNEALSNRKAETPVVDKKSWSANRFEDKYEEKMKLNYKDLLNNGYLG